MDDFKKEEKKEEILYSVQNIDSVEMTGSLPPTSSIEQVSPFLPQIQPTLMTPRKSYSQGSIRRHISISSSSHGAYGSTPCEVNHPSSSISNHAHFLPLSTPIGTPVSLKPAPDKSIKIPIAGVSVEFPFEPYPVQKYMMSQMLLALNKAQHCLIESPTGTGKTLALLCSALAWQKKETELLSELIQCAEQEKVSMEHTKSKERPKTNIKSTPLVTNLHSSTNLPESSNYSSDEEVFRSPKRPKKNTTPKSASEIKYQVSPSEPNTLFPSKVGTNKNTTLDSSFKIENKEEDTEKPSENVVRPPRIFYGSRTHKQISQVVHQLQRTVYAQNIKMTILASREMTCVNGSVQGQPNVTDVCQALIDSQGDGCSYYTGALKSHKSLEGAQVPPVYDIEDIVKVGSRRKFCPYFTLRSLANTSQIVFCPYNYLIDPSIRESVDINTDKDIVIIDEGHNIEDICREAGSLLLKQTELDDAIKVCKENISRYIKPGCYKVIEAYLQSLDDWLNVNGSSSEYQNDTSKAVISNGQELINKLHVAGITEEMFTQFLENIDSINKKPENPDDEFLSMKGIVRKVCNDIRKVFHYIYRVENMSKYQAYLSREIVNKRLSTAKDGWLTKHRGEERVWKYNLHVLCLSPDIVFSELLGARSIVIASGTLSPIDSFEAELRVKFPWVVHGRHVVSAQNVFVSSVTSGPQRLILKGVYENVNTYEYQDELGRAILETAKVVPHGVLCFFPSYTLMDKVRDRWTMTGFMDSLANVKEVHWEPRDKKSMSSVMNEFNSCIELSTDNPKEELGAILFGVFRGKIAEGIDFSDDFARVVITVGIPFPNRNSKDVELKMKYNDSQNSVLSGSRWYKIQAYRALNQAVGRCLRHKEDWGAIILLDSRFSYPDTQQNLPKWIQQQVKPYQNWGHYLNSLSSFCNRMNKSDL